MILLADSADEWEQVVSDCFVPLRCLAFEDSFHGRIEFERFGSSVSVSKVNTDGLSAERSRRLGLGSSADDLHISLQLSSTGIVSQDGHSAVVRPRSITTYATDRPYHLDYSAPSQNQLIIQISRRMLGVPEEMVAAARRRLRVSPSISSRLLFDFVSDLHQTAPPTGESRSAVTADLTAAMLRTSFASHRVLPTTRTGLLLAIEDHMRANLTRKMDIEAVAAAFFISRRSLYQLFELRSVSPADYLRRLRLSAAADSLRAGDPQLISDIAYCAGFTDTTTFTRAFRRAYGMTPTEFRHAQGRYWKQSEGNQ